MAEQYFESMVQKLPSACVTDITPPTFAGIASAVAQPNGSILASWLSGSDLSTPLTYEIYCLPGTVAAAVLFAAPPALKSGDLSEYVFRDSNEDLLVAGDYTLGVRCRDAVGNIETNLVVIVETTTDVLTDDLATIAASLAATELALNQDVTDLDTIESALALDAASIAASEASLAADLSLLSAIITDSQTVLDSLSSAGGTSLTAELEVETVLNVEDIETV